MGKGARPPAEFVRGVPRRKLALAQRLLPSEIETPPHIDLRVVRHARLDQYLAMDWHIFLAQLGAQNHYIGCARSLGSIALTHVPSHLMNIMLENRQPRDYGHPKRKESLFRKVSAGITNFLQDCNHQAAEMQAAALLYAREEASKAEGLVLSDGTTLSSPIPDWGRNNEDEFEPILFLEGPSQLADEHPYGPATLTVRGLELYGRRYGLDLSLNEILFDERRGIISYLRTAERLDTSVLSRDWDAHGSVFDLHDHVGEPSLTYESSTLPRKILYSAPEVEHRVFQ